MLFLLCSSALLFTLTTKAKEPYVLKIIDNIEHNAIFDNLFMTQSPLLNKVISN